MEGADDPGGSAQPAQDAQPQSPSLSPPWGYGAPPPYVPPPYGPPGYPPPGYAPTAYGQPPYGQPYSPYPRYLYDVPRSNGMAVAATVLGIIGILLSILLVPSVLAIIFGAIGRNRAVVRAGEGRGLAIAGIVLGIVGVVLGLTLWVLMTVGTQVPVGGPGS